MVQDQSACSHCFSGASCATQWPQGCVGAGGRRTDSLENVFCLWIIDGRPSSQLQIKSRPSGFSSFTFTQLFKDGDVHWMTSGQWVLISQLSIAFLWTHRNHSVVLRNNNLSIYYTLPPTYALRGKVLLSHLSGVKTDTSWTGRRFIIKASLWLPIKSSPLTAPHLASPPSTFTSPPD